MKHCTRLYFFFFVFVAFLLGCNEQPREIQNNTSAKPADNLIAVNKYLVSQDADKIKGYISRRNWNMEITKTGLFYRIYKKGNGEKVQLGDTLKINYTITLLDGSLCYSSEKDGPKTFIVGKGSVEPGLEEGALLLHKGDNACFILMPHLAHGLIGDENRIPARATIVYDVELIQINH